MIKLRATIIDLKELDKLLKLLIKDFNVLRISKEYKNRKSNLRNIYIDVEKK